MAGWLLDEMASAGRENPHGDHAARCDGKEDADAVEEIGLLRRLGLTAGPHVVDIGARTGQFTAIVAPPALG